MIGLCLPLYDVGGVEERGCDFGSRSGCDCDFDCGMRKKILNRTLSGILNEKATLLASVCYVVDQWESENVSAIVNEIANVTLKTKKAIERTSENETSLCPCPYSCPSTHP